MRVPSHQRLLVGISGIPGAGKSTLALALADELSKLGKQAAIVGMDGWHYSRAQLDTFPNPAYAHARRGAAFTFDAEAFVAFASELRSPGEPFPQLHAPAFSHAEKDPIAGAISVGDARIVLIEGLYCNISVEPWCRAAALWDVRWLVTVPEDVARQRLVVRHVESGITRTHDEALFRGALLLTSQHERPTEWRVDSCAHIRAHRMYRIHKLSVY